MTVHDLILVAVRLGGLVAAVAVLGRVPAAQRIFLLAGAVALGLSGTPWLVVRRVADLSRLQEWLAAQLVTQVVDVALVLGGLALLLAAAPVAASADDPYARPGAYGAPPRLRLVPRPDASRPESPHGRGPQDGRTG